MAFGLTVGTPRATALQNSIRDEVMMRGYSQNADEHIAEYITVMIINGKTSDYIISDLTELTGWDIKPSFGDWLFTEAAKGAPESVVPPTAETPTSAQTHTGETVPLANEGGTFAFGRLPALHHQALNQDFSGSAGQKRPMSSRSPSPTRLNKARRMDLPTGPFATFQDGQGTVHDEEGGLRSLREQVGLPRNGANPCGPDNVQMRPDNITASSANANMMMQGMMLSQMTQMSQMVLFNQMQMVSAAHMMGGRWPHVGGGGFPMQQQGMGSNVGFGEMQGHHQGMAGRGHKRGRGGSRRGTGHGREGVPGLQAVFQPTDIPVEGVQPAPAPTISPTVFAPIPTPAAAIASTIHNPAAQVHSAVVLPEQPQSPPVCKSGVNCTDELCQYLHPSACQKGKGCKDSDRTMSHASLKSSIEQLRPSFITPPVIHGQSQMPCQYGASCTRPDCIFQHPGRPSNHMPSSSIPCQYGAACTRISCSYQHPKSRAALRSNGMQGFNKSVIFNKPSTVAEIEKRQKKMEEKKSQPEKAIAQGEAAAAEEKDQAPANGA